MTDNIKEYIDENILAKITKDFYKYQVRYKSAIRQLRARLETLNEEFNLNHKRNPIHHMESRLKTPLSILQKLKRKGFELSMDSAIDLLTDIAGVRVVCSYIDDTYHISKLLIAQDDIDIIRIRDYIENPKENGYRSLHLIVTIPVYLNEQKYKVPVEIQIRTIAMDFWASLEHRLRYKENLVIPKALNEELIKTADEIENIDKKMQLIYNMVQELNPEEAKDYYIKHPQMYNNYLQEKEENLFSPLNK